MTGGPCGEDIAPEGQIPGLRRRRNQDLRVPPVLLGETLAEVGAVVTRSA
jgi:hypothetical protein